MTAPKISVIMPVYNSQEYLPQCLDTLINQTLTDIEIICVDDGSTDASGDILREYSEKDSRIKVIRQANGGAGAARNNGMQYATGEYLSILDADDFYEVNMLEKAYAQAKLHDAEIVVFGCDHYNHKSGSFSPNNYSIHRELLPQNNPFAATDVKKDIFKLFVGWSWDKLFKRSFTEENNLKFQEQRTTNDMLFVFSAIVKAQRVSVLDEVLVHHRQTEGTLSVTREKSWHCFYDALTALKNQLVEWDLFERFRQDYLNYCVHFSLWNLNTLAEPTKTILHNKLRDEWFEQMGVTDFDEKYYYNKYEYHQYRNVYEYPPEWQPPKTEIVKNNMRKCIIKFSRAVTMVKEKGVIYTAKNIASKLRRKGKN